MSYEKYCELINQLCERFDIPDPQSNYEMLQIVVENNRFSLAHTEVDADYLTVFSDFGKIPEQNANTVLRRLLEGHMLMFASKSPRFSINSDTGHVVLISQLPLEGLTLDALVATLSVYAISANDWRSNYFLDMEGDMMKEPSNVSSETGIAAH